MPLFFHAVTKKHLADHVRDYIRKLEDIIKMHDAMRSSDELK